MIKIAPSILSADFSRLGEEIRLIKEAGADLVHIDVMDGAFVPNISMGPCVVSSIRNITDMFFDCHLMVKNPEMFIEPFVKAGADLITVHAECDIDLCAVIDKIHSYGIKAAAAVNPATDIECLRSVLPKLDMVLIMSVVPGFGGQKFMGEVLAKVAKLRKMPCGDKVCVEIDGGINEQTAPLAAKAGVDILVAGSAVYNAPSYKNAIASLKNAADSNE